MRIETTELAPGLTVSRIAKGNWQLSARHGAAYDRGQAIEDMRKFVEAGITLFDCADHYVGVEQLIGEFRRKHPEHAKRIAISTKLVPDSETLATVSKADIESIVDTSLARLGVEALDLVQFHWWEYGVPRYLDALGWLAELRRAGKVRHIGTTNFDLAHLREIVAAGIPLATPSSSGRCSTGGPSAAWRTFAGRTGSRCCATARSPAASQTSAGSARPILRRRSRTVRSSSTA